MRDEGKTKVMRSREEVGSSSLLIRPGGSTTDERAVDGVEAVLFLGCRVDLDHDVSLCTRADDAQWTSDEFCCTLATHNAAQSGRMSLEPQVPYGLHRWRQAVVPRVLGGAGGVEPELAAESEAMGLC